MLRLNLPPNLAAAIVRDVVPIKVELDLATVPAPGLLPVLAVLQRLCGATPPAFIQLTRAQLREIATAAADQHSNDRNHHQQLHQGKSSFFSF